ncbi:MAG: DUF3604 domain-containing protein [Pseudomonadota bacterium]
MKNKLKLFGKGLLLAGLVVAGALAAILKFGMGNELLWMQPAAQDVGHAIAPSSAARPPANPLKNAYFGETHVHTGYSLDANLFGTKYDPRMAYRFARGESVFLSEAHAYQRISAPLDFVAVTDHAEGMGATVQCNDPNSKTYWSLDCIGVRYKLLVTYKRLMANVKQQGKQTGSYNPGMCGDGGKDCIEAAKSIWLDEQNAANEYYQPGVFTTFIAYEFSPTLVQGGMLHRNVIFRGSKVPDSVFSAFDGFAEDMLRWLERTCQGECQALSIPHNPNLSWGLMFGDTNSDGTPLTRENLALRARLEKLVEIFQIKGNSECAAGINNNDEQCQFENLWPVCTPEQLVVDPKLAQHAPRCVAPHDLVRNVLKKGLAAETKWGFNPFKLGFAGGGDNHNATPGDTNPATFRGHAGAPDGTPELRLGIKHTVVGDALGMPVAALNPGGLTGVWAEENTREAIFDAMKRKETFATSGTRLRVRLFGGFGLPANLHLQADAVATAIKLGVPMGGDLRAAKPGEAPGFLAMALRDANSAPLQKIQIVKGWTSNGQTQERVYDIACSDGLRPDPASHRCADNGATVKLADCSISQDKGAAQLATTWTDPDFQAGQAAFYYVRVLENPVCRWSQYDASRLHVPHPANVPPTIQQRAWGSPIWYTPAQP